MPLELQPLAAADILRTVKIENSAYAANPFTPTLFPGPFGGDPFAVRTKELAAELEKDDTVRWWKVIDTELPAGDDQIVAVAKWHIYHDGRKPTAKRRWDFPGMNTEACEAVFGPMDEDRVRLFGMGPHVCE